MTRVENLDISHIALLSAAGPAAQVPSRIGNEIPAVLGSTRPDGSSLRKNRTMTTTRASSRPTRSGSNRRPNRKKRPASKLAHASSAIVLVLLMLAALGGFLYIRRRNRTATGGGAFAVPPASPTTTGSGPVPSPDIEKPAQGGEHEQDSDGWWSPLSGSAVEGLAHASSAIVLVLLMLAALPDIEKPAQGGEHEQDEDDRARGVCETFDGTAREISGDGTGPLPVVVGDAGGTAKAGRA
jgi:hypothetical protein